MNRLGIIIMVLTLGSGCASVKKPASTWRCVEHGAHTWEGRDDFIACTGCGNPDDYQLFSVRKRLGPREAKDSVLHHSREMLLDEMAEYIRLKVEQFFAEATSTGWKLEKTTMPVIIRQYTSEREALTIGLIRKEDLTARALIRYLPLEYKMQLMGSGEIIPVD
jgi:hypothetical protein